VPHFQHEDRRANPSDNTRLPYALAYELPTQQAMSPFSHTPCFKFFISPTLLYTRTKRSESFHMQRAVLFCLLSLLAVNVAAKGMMLGGASQAPIDARTNEIATFAVEQLKHGKANFAITGNLHLSKVVSAKRQVRHGHAGLKQAPANG
jgi:hypothetical protein